jgi:hypothetical protein
MEEIADAFGSGLALEMKAVLVVQGAANMRNDIAPGLMDDNAALSYNSLYMWCSACTARRRRLVFVGHFASVRRDLGPVSGQTRSRRSAGRSPPRLPTRLWAWLDSGLRPRRPPWWGVAGMTQPSLTSGGTAASIGNDDQTIPKARSVPTLLLLLPSSSCDQDAYTCVSRVRTS